jgi:hypothetical protein
MTTKKKLLNCIDASKVPCPKARDYLEKHGLLCGVHPDDKSKKTEQPKKKRKEGFFSRIFG